MMRIDMYEHMMVVRHSDFPNYFGKKLLSGKNTFCQVCGSFDPSVCWKIFLLAGKCWLFSVRLEFTSPETWGQDMIHDPIFPTKPMYGGYEVRVKSSWIAKMKYISNLLKITSKDKWIHDLPMFYKTKNKKCKDQNNSAFREHPRPMTASLDTLESKNLNGE